jgi:GNAT superfamily N-acetyltransferase
LPVAVYVSPACTPRDLPARLLSSGFDKLAEEEAWLALEDLPDLSIPSPHPKIAVKRVTEDEVASFATVFTTAFGMPADFAPAMAQLLKPSVGLPNVDHYLAASGDEPIGTCSLLRYKTFGVLGSVGVVQGHRRSGAATNLVIRAVGDAREQGVETIMLQTTAGTPLERLLRISGFTMAFTRSCYVLSNDFPG